jgi:hypothetical protein
MFIGHFGIGFGAKKFAPKLSLGFLFIAAQFIDLLWPVLLLLNIEHVVISPGITKLTPFDFVDYPISHSLIMVLLWGILLGIICWFFLKNVKFSFVIFFIVLSHWLLDLIVHRPDLPLLPGNELRFGLGLWNYQIASIITEVIIFAAGLYFYYRTTKPKNNFGKYGLIILVVLFITAYIMNIISPPPTDIKLIAWAGNLQWLFILLAFFVDRNRVINLSNNKL